MAFGNEETTLQNFDKTIKDEVFIEVTGISLDDFRVLRDEYEFFDEVVFNQSIKEFINLKDKLSNYFDKNQEDIFDYIPLQRTNQVYTPRKVVVAMLDSLATDDPNIFRDKDKTFSDLYMKSGLYITEIVKRLYVGLENVIPDHQSRLRHILENQVYGFAPSEIIYHIAKNFIEQENQSEQALQEEFIFDAIEINA
ncbi:hypothetical protein A5883_003667 [Enterococcus sp. 5B3_DIV0040]|nr:hypothetical protein A5883_003667 [Enterococcus sp. 5B3_DIV0040]